MLEQEVGGDQGEQRQGGRGEGPGLTGTSASSEEARVEIFPVFKSISV